MKKLYFILIALLLFLGSCIKEVELKDIDVEQYICINGMFCPDNYFTVNICKTGHNSIDSKILPVENAKVVLWSGNELIEELTMDSVGYYSTKINKPVANKEYTIKVDVPGFKQVTATDIVPDEVPIVKHNVIFDNYYAENWIFSTLLFSFLDPESVKNYYLINIKRIFNKSYLWTDTAIGSRLIRSDDEIFFRDENHSKLYGAESNSFLIFNDENIFNLTNNNYRINYFEDNVGSVYADTLYYNTTTDILILKNISKNMYEFYKSYNVFTVIVNESVINQSNYYFNLYSNVENGYGIFAGYNNYLDTFLLKGEKYNCTEF